MYEYDEEVLCHHGVKGMKWGIRRTPEQLGHKTGSSKKKTASAKTSSPKSSTTKKPEVKKPSIISRASQTMAKRKEVKQQKAEEKKQARAEKKPEKKNISELSDAELRSRINRMEMEKRYRDLTVSLNPPKQKSATRKIAESIVTKSIENVGAQTVTYFLGTGVNKAASRIFNDPAIINPKKGQKDK